MIHLLLTCFPPCMAGGGGSGFVAMGTQPMAAARANGSHAATDAIPTLLEDEDEEGAITTTVNQRNLFRTFGCKM